MRSIKNRFARLNAYRLFPALFVLLCVVIGVLCFQYYLRLQETLKTENKGYLQEISKQMSVNISKTISDNFSVLGTISTVLQNTSVVSYEQIQPVVAEQQRYWGYQSILLVDERGTAYDGFGNTVTLSGDQYLQDTVLKKARSMSASQIVNGRECIIFSAPLENVVLGGVKMHALAASYDLNAFDKILSMTAFDGRGFAHIISPNGSVVVRSSAKAAGRTGYNILSSVIGPTPDGAAALAAIQGDIAAGRSGQMEFNLQGEPVYMSYIPLVGHEWCLLTFVPLEVVNEKSQLLLTITLLLCGGITVAFATLFSFLALSLFRHRRALEQIAYVDPITGGHTIQKFYQLAQPVLDDPARSKYALVYTNIEKFKVLNERFGRGPCDNALKGISMGIASELAENEHIGRIFADNFCVLVSFESEEDLIERFKRWRAAYIVQMEQTNFLWLPLTIDFGVYVIGASPLPFPQMIDRAKLSLREGTRPLPGKLRYAIYSEQVRQRLFRDKHLEEMMEEALLNREFQVYLQPKYCTDTEEIGGAEALVRWVSSFEGMIAPDDFIPLFEKNGFVIQLDLWVFEEVCATLRTWLDAGYTPMKISVNCSRMHLKSLYFLDQYHIILDHYHIPPGLIEIELTESVLFEDAEHLTRTIAEIHAAGFSCSMDDFGSGYSSLSLIQDIPVDVLKLDRVFFRSGSKDLGRTASVVGSIISMARALSMETVAEGVEERVHVDMLKGLGCDYIQGFYFAKPMPIADFERLAFGASLVVPAPQAIPKEDFT